LLDVGVRCADGTVLAVVVNHAPEPQVAAVRLGSLPFVPGAAQDLVTFGPVGVVGEPDGSVALSLRVAGRDARYVALYPRVPKALRLRSPPPAVPRGGTLAYDVDLGVPGVWLVDLTVTDPEGNVHGRLGGARATGDGRCRVTETLPINARRGTWRVVARVPQVGLETEATFQVE